MVSFKYQVVKKRGFASSASISVSGERGVVVRAPFWMPKGMIDNFIEEKSDWIQRSLKRLNTKKISKKYVDGEKHLYFGKEYPLSINKVKTISRSQVRLIEEHIQVDTYEGLPTEKLQEIIKEALTYWYLEKGIEVITEKVNFFAKEIGVNYTKINLKKVSSIWGSCSPTNCLSFNRKLVMAPHEVVDYVVIHEVVHMVHRNHGQEFWNLVARYDPQYKNHRKWLKLNHHLLAM
ncbi:MAG TPA: SprT family zinc-dependent metalloprotease [Spirochaetia bacterium]|nr:SprT family zinc-dependent metalloprotease [Spirochaetia bacterium]